MAAKHRHIVFFCRGKALRIRPEGTGEQKRGEFIGKHLIIDPEPLLRRQLIDIADFRIAKHLQPHRFKMVKIACQLQTGTGHILHSQLHTMVVSCGKCHLQTELFHQTGQRNMIDFLHGIPFFPHFTDIILERRKKINNILKNQKNLKKTLAFFVKLWYHI